MFSAPKAKRQVHELKTPQERYWPKPVSLRRVTAGAYVFAVTRRLKPNVIKLTIQIMGIYIYGSSGLHFFGGISKKT
jgi:hypothetical protein